MLGMSSSESVFSIMMNKKGLGGDFLTRRSDVAQAKAELPKLRDVLIVEDHGFDAKRLTATLHIVLGRDTIIRIATSLDKAIDEVLKQTPDMIFLDDYLKPSDSALDTIPLIRRAGYAGPIVVISGEWDRERAIELKRAGASESVHKDDVNSVDLGAVLLRAFGAKF